MTSTSRFGAALLALTVVVAGLAAPAHAQIFSDNFDDGDDNGWTRYQPLSTFGAPGTWTFPSGAYRIQAAGSPNPGTLGPGRAGSARTDINLSDFHLEVDVLDWNNSLSQGFGLSARVNQIGLGTTDSYLLLYLAGTAPSFVINRTDNETPVAIGAGAAITLDPGQDYRFRFTGTGSSLMGQVFNLTNLTTPLATVTAIDGTYLSGNVGLLVASTSTTAGAAADATFDNFVVVPEPTSLALLGIAAGALRWVRRKAPRDSRGAH
jgi:pectate lyase